MDRGEALGKIADDFFAEAQDALETIQHTLRHRQHPQDATFHRGLKAIRDGQALARALLSSSDSYRRGFEAGREEAAKVAHNMIANRQRAGDTLGALVSSHIAHGIRSLPLPAQQTVSKAEVRQQDILRVIRDLARDATKDGHVPADDIRQIICICNEELGP